MSMFADYLAARDGVLAEGVFDAIGGWFKGRPHPAEDPTPPAQMGPDNWKFGPKSQADLQHYMASVAGQDPFFTFADMSKVLGYKVTYGNQYQAMEANNGGAVVKVNPCMLLKKFFTQGLPQVKDGTHKQNKYDDKWGAPFDPGLPMVKVIGTKVLIDEGNHRLMSACQKGMPSAFIFVKYFGNFDILKPTVTQVVQNKLGTGQKAPQHA